MLVSLFGINFLFGTTWVFAIFTFTATNANVSFSSQLIFVLSSALQGFFIFFFFVVLNSDARQAWQKVLCFYKKKKKPQRTTSTSDKFPVKSNTGSNVGTLSSTLPFFQMATLERNMPKYDKNELLTFSNPTTVEESEEESAPVQVEPPLERSPVEALPKVPLEQPDGIEGAKQKGRLVRGRVQRRSTMRHTHDIETVEVEFGWSSNESLDDKNI